MGNRSNGDDNDDDVDLQHISAFLLAKPRPLIDPLCWSIQSSRKRMIGDQFQEMMTAIFLLLLLKEHTMETPASFLATAGA